MMSFIFQFEKEKVSVGAGVYHKRSVSKINAEILRLERKNNKKLFECKGKWKQIIFVEEMVVWIKVSGIG